MYYSGIKKADVANCIGIGVSLFVSGCRNCCEGCFNQETWNFRYGDKFTDEVAQEVLDACDHPWISTLTLLGGDPMEKENVGTVLELCKAFRERYGNSKKLWLYTGYYYEDLIKDKTSYELIKLLDIMVDSPFEMDKKVAGLKLRGSTNQRIIDIQKSISSGNVVLSDI